MRPRRRPPSERAPGHPVRPRDAAANTRAPDGTSAADARPSTLDVAAEFHLGLPEGRLLDGPRTSHEDLDRGLGLR